MKVFDVLKTHKADDEYVWKEYIKFLHLQVAIQIAKKRLVENEKVPLKDFVVHEPDFTKVFSSIYHEMHEAMIKRMQSVMTLGWHNDK